MDNLDSCLPVSKPYFLSIEGYSGKKPGAASVEPAGFFPQYQHSVDKKIPQAEIVSSAPSPILEKPKRTAFQACKQKNFEKKQLSLFHEINVGGI